MQYPNDMKLAKVIEIHKKKAHGFQPCNYRPISLLSCFNKNKLSDYFIRNFNLQLQTFQQTQRYI